MPFDVPSSDRSPSVVDMFRANVSQARRRAVQQGLVSLTYGALDERSNQLARRLTRLGIGCGSRVGIALNRSVDTIVLVLAVLKTGAAYVPLDPSYPPAAIAFMIDDALPDAVVGSQASCTSAAVQWCAGKPHD